MLESNYLTAHTLTEAALVSADTALTLSGYSSPDLSSRSATYPGRAILEGSEFDRNAAARSPPNPGANRKL
jgi:hypothetical protein